MDRVSQGAAVVTVTGVPEAEAAARLAMSARVDDEVGRKLASILSSARASWPVRTGLSRSGLDLTRSVGPDRQKHSIRNSVEYADDVRARGTKTPSWEVLVVAPVERSRLELELALRGSLPRDIQRAIDKAR